MAYITLNSVLTTEGIEYSHPVLGKIATLKKDYPTKGDGWFVFPYCFQPYERGATFKSLAAAEQYALALAYEQHELRGRS